MQGHPPPNFTPRLDILPAPQRRLWDELVAVPREFVLYGGTALALQLGHRQSLDFDFFGDRPLDPTSLVPAIAFLAGAVVTQRATNIFSCTVDRGGTVNLSFFGAARIPRLSPPLIARDNNLQVASLLDLAGAKASVVQMRAEAEDHLDIDALLADGRIDLSEVLAAARAIFGDQFNPQSTLKALSYFEDGNLRRLPRTVKNRLVQAARAVDLDRLPEYQRPARRAGPNEGDPSLARNSSSRSALGLVRAAGGSLVRHFPPARLRFRARDP